MKKILLTTAALIGLVLACNAMSVTEQVILSKTVETAPISLVAEVTVDALSCNKMTCLTSASSCDCRQTEGAERLALKALKNIGRLLVKGICRIASSDSQNQQPISYAGGHYYDARMMVRTNLCTLVR